MPVYSTPQPTVDPDVFIEATGSTKGKPFVRYWQRPTLRRWEVRGSCQRLGDCLIGSVITLPDGTPHLIADQNDLKQLVQSLGLTRIDAYEDVPVTPEFDTCCAAAGYLTFVELPRGPFGG